MDDLWKSRVHITLQATIRIGTVRYTPWLSRTHILSVIKDFYRDEKGYAALTQGNILEAALKSPLEAYKIAAFSSASNSMLDRPRRIGAQFIRSSIK